MAAVLAPSKRLPTYCPLRIPYDAERLHDELIGLLPKFESLAPAAAALKRRSEWFEIGDDYLYENVEHNAPDPSQSEDARVFVPGKVPSWWGISLTHVPGRPETQSGSSRYRGRYDGKWAWKPGLKLPYARQLVENLSFDKLNVVRVMSLPAGGFGPAHVDCKDDSPWETDGVASITFLLRDGGVPMRFMAADKSVHDVNDSVFFFKDCAPHGIPRTTSRRLLLRINGAGSKRLMELMRSEDAIW